MRNQKPMRESSTSRSYMTDKIIQVAIATMGPKYIIIEAIMLIFLPIVSFSPE